MEEKKVEAKWTDEQKLAIYEKDKNILVAAAAGSGKTSVLVERIINKIINDKIDIDKILVVTFTKAAASEMKAKILNAIYKKIQMINIFKDKLCFFLRQVLVLFILFVLML